MLALVMNNRPMDSKLTSTLFDKTLERIEKAKSKDVFYLAMAIGRGLGKKFAKEDVKGFSDLVYNLYLVSAREINDFDLFQLAQISSFMSSPAITEGVPDQFWTEALEPALDNHLANFVKYQEQLDRPTYLADFIKCLFGLGFREISSPLFLAKVERVILPHVQELSSQALEGLLFFLMRAGTAPTASGAATRNVEILEAILK